MTAWIDGVHRVVPVEILYVHDREPYNQAKELVLEKYPNAEITNFFGREDFAQNFVNRPDYSHWHAKRGEINV
jgi:hypothetical protein